MSFILEEVSDGVPNNLVEEHWRLVAWMKAHRVGAYERLHTRMVNLNESAALYYIEGFGMGRGAKFALVRGEEIYVTPVYSTDGRQIAEAPAIRVSDVSLPEFSVLDRDAIKDLLTDALSGYCEMHQGTIGIAFGSNEGSWFLDWTVARWVVRPNKYSLLYWRKALEKRWHFFQKVRWQRIWSTLSSPLTASLALTGSALTGSRWSVALAGVWLTLRTLQYNTEWRLSSWVLGQVKFRDPLHMFQLLNRNQNPSRLSALKVRIERIELEPSVCRVRIVNCTFVPLPFVSIGAYSLAELLAPGLKEALQRENSHQAFDDTMKELESKFPTMTKRWLWPRQSFASTHRLLANFPPATNVRAVMAFVDIPRFVSGEPRSGMTSFLLEIEEQLT